jgi:hypothetical protein
VVVKFKARPIIDLNKAASQFRASRYLESSEVETPEKRNPKAPLDMSPRSWPEVACRMERWRGVVPKAKAPISVTEEDLHGLEASGLTRSSRGHRLEHSWVSGLVPIPMKVVNGNDGGG